MPIRNRDLARNGPHDSRQNDIHIVLAPSAVSGMAAGLVLALRVLLLPPRTPRYRPRIDFGDLESDPPPSEDGINIYAGFDLTLHKGIAVGIGTRAQIPEKEFGPTPFAVVFRRHGTEIRGSPFKNKAGMCG